jgi:hypothetical protein
MADFPLSAAAGKEVFEDYDAHFEEGLAVVIARIEAGYRWSQGLLVRVRRTARVTIGGSRSAAIRRAGDLRGCGAAGTGGGAT